MTAIKERGETQFSEAGDGVVLCFRNADCKRIQAAINSKTWLPDITQDMLSGAIDMEVIDLLIEHGAKKNGQPTKIPEEVLDKISIADLVSKLMDALYIAVHMKTFREYVDDVAEKMTAARERGDPPLSRSPDTTS